MASVLKSNRTILPKDWKKAPLIYYNNRRLSALWFMGANFLIGTIAIWLPLLTHFLSGGRQGEPLSRLLEQDAFYFFATPFIAAVGSVVISEAHKNSEQSRDTRDLLIFWWFVFLFLCAVVSGVDVAISGPKTCIELAFQVLLSLSSVVVGCYLYAIFQNEVDGSAADDINQDAYRLQVEANASQAKASDFEYEGS